MSELFAILALLATVAGTAALVLGLFEAVKQISRKLVVAADDGALLSHEEGAATAGSSMTALRKTVIAFLAVLNKGWVPQKYLDALAVRLRRAGHPHELKPEEIVGLMELGAFFFLLLGLAVTLWLDFAFYWVPLAMLFGASYPLIWLRDQVKIRHHQITRALPYNLDLLTLSVEAGLDFAAALGKVVRRAAAARSPTSCRSRSKS